MYKFYHTLYIIVSNRHLIVYMVTTYCTEHGYFQTPCFDN